MFKAKTTVLSENQAIKYQILENDRLLSFNQILQYWEKNDDFIDFFNETLGACNFKAFFWETPPMTNSKLKNKFEFVLTKSNLLANIPADVNTFHYYFSTTDQQNISFSNLGGDAQMVVPVPISEKNNYSHLASFVRNAPIEQKRNFWKVVAHEYSKKINQRPVWLSTAGLGVAWLHVRIDKRPKYYRHQAYR